MAIIRHQFTVATRIRRKSIPFIGLNMGCRHLNTGRHNENGEYYQLETSASQYIAVID